MRSDLEQMYMVLVLGRSQLHVIAKAAELQACEDLRRAEQLVYEAALLIGKHINPDKISILRKDLA